MPHFSPINWLITGFIFYFILMVFVMLMWWMQNYMFSKKLNMNNFNFKNNWNWA